MTTARDKKKGKPIGNNTRLHERYGNTYEIRLHGNLIMIIHKDRIELLDGGWRTVTTKARLNEHIPSGFFVRQKNFEWYIEHHTSADDVTYKFGDVYWIHNDNRVMLYSTHPKYPDRGEEE